MFNKPMIAKYSIRILITTLLTGLCLSCNIYDDLGGCPPAGLSLHYAYHPNMEARDAFRQKVGQTSLFLYKPDGSFVASYTNNHAELTIFQGVRLPFLPDGSYTAVAIANNYSQTLIADAKNLAGASFGAPAAFSSGDVSGNDSLYFARRELTVKGGRLLQDSLHFRSAHIKMRLFLKGLEQEAQAGKPAPLAFRMTQLARRTDFAGIPSDDRMTYKIAPLRPETSMGIYYISFNTLLFRQNTEASVELYDIATGTVRHSLPMARYIAEQQLVVDGRDEVTVSILFSLSGAGVSVQPWQKDPVDPIFD